VASRPGGGTSLAIETFGTSGNSFVFLHGLFGRGRNWASIAQSLQPHSSVLVDLPNHGNSPWTCRFSYLDMVAEVVGTLVSLQQQVCLVGHSMGGRVAMATALHHPRLVDRLVIVDTEPIDQPIDHLRDIAQAMADLDLGTVASRQEAHQLLRRTINDELLLRFLVQGLTMSLDRTWRWTHNLDVIVRDMALVGAWHDIDAIYTGPVLWITGSDSTATSGDPTLMRKYFPSCRHLRVKQAGHWVHADAPDVVTEALRQFIN